MKNIIKKILSEQKEKYDTLELLRSYQGKNKILNDLSLELRVRGRLSKTKIDKAISEFKKEFYAPTILDSLRNNTKLHSEIMSLGTKAYNDLIRSNKRLLLGGAKKVKVSKPDRNWISRNVSDLLFFKKNIPKNNKKFSFPDRETELTIEEECNKLIRQLAGRDFWGFIEGHEWSVLNRINTNYTNWIKLISKRDASNELIGNTAKEKVQDYFRQRPIEQIYNFMGMDKNQKSMVIDKVPTLSFADEDILELLISADDSENDYDFNKMISRIKRTTEKGEQAESKFISDIIEGGIPKDKIKLFSSYGNLVDITFQCDLMVEFDGVYRPIQIKSSEAKYSKLLSYDIGGLLIYPAPSEFNCGKWVYFDGKSLPKSFDEDFLNLSC